MWSGDRSETGGNVRPPAGPGRRLDGRSQIAPPGILELLRVARNKWLAKRVSARQAAVQVTETRVPIGCELSFPAKGLIMNESEPSYSRRQFFDSVGATVAGTVIGATSVAAAEPPPAAKVPVDPAKARRLSGVDVKNLADEYERRDLGAVSDADLCEQAARIISRPPEKTGREFQPACAARPVARYGLLPLVDPRERKLARLQLIASTANFEELTTG